MHVSLTLVYKIIYRPIDNDMQTITLTSKKYSAVYVTKIHILFAM